LQIFSFKLYICLNRMFSKKKKTQERNQIVDKKKMLKINNTQKKINEIGSELFVLFCMICKRISC